MTIGGIIEAAAVRTQELKTVLFQKYASRPNACVWRKEGASSGVRLDARFFIANCGPN
jgi:hypothetical protein